MTWTHGFIIALTASVALLAGCNSTEVSHDPGMDHQAPASQPSADSDVELIGMPGLQDPIPARSVEVSALGLSCPLCAHNLDKQLNMIEGVSSVEVDLSTGLVRVAFEDTACITPQQLITSVEDAGFSVTQIKAVHVPKQSE